MRFTKNIGFLLLAIFLILYGLIALLSLSFAGLGVIMGLLAIAAGSLHPSGPLIDLHPACSRDNLLLIN